VPPRRSVFRGDLGASPVPASSGTTIRHRLNPARDRQANRALHLIAVCRLRHGQRTRAYAERRAREGKSQREIMRCLKRYIAREFYNTLRDDLADPELSSLPDGTTGFARPGLQVKVRMDVHVRPST